MLPVIQKCNQLFFSQGLPSRLDLGVPTLRPLGERAEWVWRMLLRRPWQVKDQLARMIAITVHMAAPIKWGVRLVGVFTIRAQLFEVYITAPHFANSHIIWCNFRSTCSKNIFPSEFAHVHLESSIRTRQGSTQHTFIVCICVHTAVSEEVNAHVCTCTYT